MQQGITARPAPTPRAISVTCLFASLHACKATSGNWSACDLLLLDYLRPTLTGTHPFGPGRLVIRPAESRMSTFLCFGRQGSEDSLITIKSVCGLQYNCIAWVNAHVPFHKVLKRINQQVDSNMRRSGNKTATQRRRSSGSLKFGLLSVHETKILPTKNANFSFDTGSTYASTKGGQMHSPQGFPSTFPPHQAKQRMSTAHDPIPMPSSHIHRTASELNLIIGQKHAARREKAMFERIVSGMVNNQSDGQRSVSLQSSSTASRDHIVETKKYPRPSGSTCRSACVSSLEKARDASRSLIQSFAVTSNTVKTTSATSAAHDDSAPIIAEQDDFFVGSFRDYAKLTPPRLLKLQEAALGIDAPPTDRRRFSDVKSDRNSEAVYDNGELSDGDEFFPLDL